MQRRRRDERGETLLELLVAITLLSVCALAIGGGIALTVRVSGLHRAQSTAGAYMHNYAEAVQAAASSSWSACASTYSVSGFSTPTGYNASVVDVKYWNGSTFQSTCPVTDAGLQQVTVQVTGDGAREQLVVMVRKP
jgi:Tfp pilus assembly protein PilV